MPPAVQGKEIFKVQPFLTGLSSRLSSVAGACKCLCSPAEEPGVMLPPCAPLLHVQSCSWRPWSLSRSSYWQLCLGLTKAVPPSSLAVLQMVSQDCIEECNSWVKALKKKNQSLWQMPCLCCFESVVLLPVKLLQEASLQDEASLRFAKCQSPGLPALPAVSQCQPGAVHKDSRYYIVIWLVAFAEGATSMYRRQPNKFWYRRKYT